MQEARLRVKALTIVALLLTTSAYGQVGGDPPYLLENGWKPLLNGNDLGGWVGENGKPHDWITAKAVWWDPSAAPKMLGAKAAPGSRILNSLKGKANNLVTIEKFGDVQFYLEFLIPQGSNSGVYLQGLYEVQIFDSYGKQTLSTSDGGAIYHRWIDGKPVAGSAPKVNASRPPGQWQSYHVWFRAPRFDASGNKTENAKFLKVVHNGVLIQENVDLEGGTRSHMQIPEAATNPLMLQGDHGPVAFRNIYIRPLR
jgi:hypothetical protein